MDHFPYSQPVPSVPGPSGSAEPLLKYKLEDSEQRCEPQQISSSPLPVIFLVLNSQSSDSGSQEQHGHQQDQQQSRRKQPGQMTLSTRRQRRHGGKAIACFFCHDRKIACEPLLFLEACA